MRAYVLSLTLFLALAGVLPAAGDGTPVGPHRLVRNVDDALAGVAQAAADPKSGLDPKSAKAAAFRAALEALRIRVSEIEASLQPGKGEFHVLVDQGSMDLGQLRVAWARTGVRNDSIAEGIRIAASSYRLLRSGYGPEGVRLGQGGTLSERERRQFLRLRRSQQRFAANLQALRDQARRQGDAATAAELERFRAEAERIAWARLDLESYLNALIATSEMRGEWSANAPYVRKTARPEQYAAADQTVEDLYVDSDIGQVFTLDLGKAPEAGEPEMEAPVAAAVEYLEPVEPASEPVEIVESAEPVAEPVQPVEIIAEPAETGVAVLGSGEDEEEAEAAGEDLPEIDLTQPVVEAGATEAPEATEGAEAAKAAEPSRTAKQEPEAKPGQEPAPPPPAARPKSRPIG